MSLGQLFFCCKENSLIFCADVSNALPMDIVYTVTTTRCITLKITSVFTAVIKGAYYLRRKVIRPQFIIRPFSSSLFL